MVGYGSRFSRRLFIAGSLASPMLAAFPRAIAQDQPVDPAKLKPGEFQWHPDRSPSGPVVVLVSIPKQWVVVYRGGVRIASSSCSTGRPGHTTPSGVFVILQKDVHHHSSTYNNAPMPYMERVTWGGVALHAGNLPGYPASHGCVRLPLEFAKLLFGVTTLGTPVIIVDAEPGHGDNGYSSDLRVRGVDRGSQAQGIRQRQGKLYGSGRNSIARKAIRHSCLYANWTGFRPPSS